jgi:hypothetical protein
MLKWLLSISGNLFGFITAPIVFPLAYLLKDVKIVRNKILWIYYDDEDEFGFDVYWFKPNMDDGFIKAYLWAAIRNPAWNLQAMSLLEQKPSYYVFHYIKGILQKDGEVVYPVLNSTAVLKYIDEDGLYMDNKGPILSLRYSIIGKQFVRFYNHRNGKEYWRFSYANKAIGNIWVEFQVGYTTRATFRLKFKNITKIQ